MAHFQPENLCRRFCQRAYAVTFRRVMPCRNESRTRFIGKVVLGFEISPSNTDRHLRLLPSEKPLRPAAAPCNPSDFAFGFADDDRLTLQNCFNMRRQCAECLGLFQAARVEQVLFAEPFFCRKTQSVGELGIVAQCGMCIQGQMVACHIDVVP